MSFLVSTFLMESILIGIGIRVGHPTYVKTLHSLSFLSPSWAHHHLKHREGELVGPQNDAGTTDNALSGSGVSATCLESTWDLFSPSSSRAGHSVSILSIPAPPRHFFRGDQWPPPTLRWGMVLM